MAPCGLGLEDEGVLSLDLLTKANVLGMEECKTDSEAPCNISSILVGEGGRSQEGAREKTNFTFFNKNNFASIVEELKDIELLLKETYISDSPALCYAESLRKTLSRRL